MFPAVTIKTLEFEKLNQQLEGLEADLKLKARKDGLREMAKPLAQRVRETTPVRTGALKSTIGYRWQKDSDIALLIGSVRRVTTGATITATESGAIIKASRRSRYYIDRFVEEGTKPHLIKAWRKDRAGLKRIWINGRPAGPSVNHPGARARWTKRNALEQLRGRLLGDFTKGAARALVKYGVTAQ